jgi:hypothetical protein
MRELRDDLDVGDLASGELRQQRHLVHRVAVPAIPQSDTHPVSQPHTNTGGHSHVTAAKNGTQRGPQPRRCALDADHGAAATYIDGRRVVFRRAPLVVASKNASFAASASASATWYFAAPFTASTV